MMDRIRWYTLSTAGVSLRSIADAMLKLEYTRHRATGFRLNEVRRDYVAGRFIERLEWDEPVDDPAGGQIQVHRVELRQLTFRISTMAPQLELVQAPRSVRAFLDVLDQCAGLDLPISAISVKPTDWLAYLERAAGKVTVLAVTIGGITLSPRASASLRIIGTEEVRQFIGQLTNGRSCEVECVFRSTWAAVPT